MPPSPSLEFVHAAAGVSRRFVSWLRRAAKNYGDLLELEAVADNRLREERLEELTGAEKTKLTEAIMDYEKILADLGRIAKSETMDTFRITGEGLIKWVGDEAISLGYTGMRERSAQYWLWDAKTDSRAEEIPLPFKKKMRNVLEFYHVETYDVFHVPSQEEAERELLDFLENVKKWPRERLVYIVKNRYPLNDDTGGFWSVTQHIVQLQSLRDLWEEFMNNWKRMVEDELMKTPEFGNLKTVISQWEAEHHVKDIVDEAQKELMVKYAERIADPDDVKNEFLVRAKAIFLERVIPETKMGEVYEQIKVAVPTEKVELTKAGLRKAIRWAFLHPEMSLDAFASGQVFPLDFTTEQAREIAAKIFEKVPKKPPVVAPPSPPPSIRAYWGTSPRGLPALWVEVYVEGKLKVRGHLEVRRETRETLERIINVKIKDSIVEAGLPEDMLLVDPLLKQNVELTKTLLETAPPDVLAILKPLTEEEVLMAIPPFDEPAPIYFEDLRALLWKLDFDVYTVEGKKRLQELLDKLEREGTIFEPRPSWYKWMEEKEKVTAPAKIEFVKIRFLKDMPAIVGADLKVYGPFARGDVVELPKVNAEVIVKQEIATYTLVPPALPTEKIEALRTVVKVKADDLGLKWAEEVWSRFWKEYEARARELWSIRGVTYLEEEIENVLKAVAVPITPPTVKRERVRRPRAEVPVEAPAEVFVTPVTIPKLPMSKLPFPRAPSSEEQAVLWDAFRYEMARLGQDPYRWRENFRMHVLNRPYPDWPTVLENFSDFIEAIRTEKPFRLLPLVTLPMPWREENEQRKYDAILHFIATKLYASMDELLHALYTFGVEVTEDDVKKAVKKGFAEKNLWLTSVSKEALESLAGEKL